MRMVQTSGMELIEFHVGDSATGAPSHGDAIPRGTVRIAGVQVHLACAPGRQDDESSLKYFHAARALIEHVGACATVGEATEFR